jgi:hypothetical protein
MKTLSLRILFLVSILALATLACGVDVNIPRETAGATQTLEISEAAPSGAARLDINMGAGTLELGTGSSKLVEGTIRYNLQNWKPTINRNGSNVEIQQKGDFKGLPPSNIINEWSLKLGNTPVDLRINAGAYRGTLDLGGAALTRLEISDGASSVDLSFDQSNPVEMSLLQYHSGASTLNLSGLANANFREMIFEAGAGSYTLDFSGGLKRDANVRISGGVSSVKIIIPKGTQADIKMTGALNNINTTGTWTTEGKTYSTSGEGPKLNITVEMGIGNLDLIQK